MRHATSLNYNACNAILHMQWSQVNLPKNTGTILATATVLILVKKGSSRYAGFKVQYETIW